MFPLLKAARKTLHRLGLLAAGLTLASCAPGAVNGPLAVAGGGSGSVRVALLVPSASPRKGDQLIAQNLQNAAQMAISDLGGARVDLKVYATDATEAGGAAAAAQAVNGGAQIILGPVYSGAARGAAQVAANAGINELTFSNNPAVAGGNVFLLGPTFANTANRLVSYAARQGRTKLVVVHEQTAAGQLGYDAITRAAAADGAQIVGDGTYVFSQQGVVKAVPQITQTIKSSGANAVFFTSDTAGALPLVTQLMVENGIDPKVTQFIGLTRWDIPPSTLALPGVQNGWFALPDPSLTKAFAARYSAAYGTAPLPVAGLAYDGIAAIGALVKSGRGLGRAALTQPDGFAGVNGIFRFLPDGTNQRGLAVAQIVNNQVQVIDPAPGSFGNAGF